MHSGNEVLQAGHIFESEDPTIPFLYDGSQEKWGQQKNYSLGVESPLTLPVGLQLGHLVAK